MNWRVVICAAAIGVAVSGGFLIYGFLAEWLHFYPVDQTAFFVLNPGMILVFPLMMAMSGMPATLDNELTFWGAFLVGTIANGVAYGLIGLFLEQFIPATPKRTASNSQ